MCRAWFTPNTSGRTISHPESSLPMPDRSLGVSNPPSSPAPQPHNDLLIVESAAFNGSFGHLHTVIAVKVPQRTEESNVTRSARALGVSRSLFGRVNASKISACICATILLTPPPLANSKSLSRHQHERTDPDRGLLGPVDANTVKGTKPWNRTRRE